MLSEADLLPAAGPQHTSTGQISSPCQWDCFVGCVGIALRERSDNENVSAATIWRFQSHPSHHTASNEHPAFAAAPSAALMSERHGHKYLTFPPRILLCATKDRTSVWSCFFLCPIICCCNDPISVNGLLNFHPQLNRFRDKGGNLYLYSETRQRGGKHQWTVRDNQTFYYKGSINLRFLWLHQCFYFRWWPFKIKKKKKKKKCSLVSCTNLICCPLLWSAYLYICVGEYNYCYVL